jgi:hypothetical protein
MVRKLGPREPVELGVHRKELFGGGSQDDKIAVSAAGAVRPGTPGIVKRPA